LAARRSEVKSSTPTAIGISHYAATLWWTSSEVRGGRRSHRPRPTRPKPEYPDFVCFQFIAHFIEVSIDPSTYQVRVPRPVSVVDCGKVLSARTARSQVLGGLVWGIGACLREASEVDPRFGGFLNANIAEYRIAVNADIGD